MDVRFLRPNRTDEYPDGRLPPSGSSHPAIRRSEAPSGDPGSEKSQELFLKRRLLLHQFNSAITQNIKSGIYIVQFNHTPMIQKHQHSSHKKDFNFFSYLFSFYFSHQRFYRMASMVFHRPQGLLYFEKYIPLHLGTYSVYYKLFYIAIF